MLLGAGMGAGGTNVLIRRQFQILATAAALLSWTISAGAQELLFSPNLTNIVPRQLDKAEATEKSATALEQVNNWTRLPPNYTFGTDSSGNNSLANTFRNWREQPPASGNSNDQFRIGNNYLAIQTRKNLQLDVLRRNECETDEACAEYFGLPKSEPPKGSAKTLKKPFIGFSITRPLQ